jgi:hypothetical protein
MVGRILASGRGSPAGDSGGVHLSQLIKPIRCREIARPRSRGVASGFSGQAEMEERHCVTLGETETGADLDRLFEGGGAAIEERGRADGVELGRPAQRDAHVVERHRAGDLALARAPLESSLEETDRFCEVGPGRAEVRDRGGVIVERSRLPAAVRIGGEVSQRRREAFPGPGEVGGRAGRAEEDSEVVKESGPLLLRREREVRRAGREVVGEGAARGFVSAPRQLLLDVKPLAECGGWIGAEGPAEMREETLRLFQNASDAVSSAGSWA